MLRGRLLRARPSTAQVAVPSTNTQPRVSQRPAEPGSRNPNAAAPTASSSPASAAATASAPMALPAK